MSRFPAGGDAAAGRRERLRGFRAANGPLHLVRDRLGGTEVQDHAKDETTFEKAEHDSADTVDPSQEHDLKDDGEQMAQEVKEDAKQQEDEKKRKRLRYLRREVDENPNPLTEKGIVPESRPTTCYQPKQRACFPHQPFRETFYDKKNQNGPDKDIEKDHSRTWKQATK